MRGSRREEIFEESSDIIKNDLKELVLRIVRQTHTLLMSHLSSELLVGKPQNNDDVK